MRNTAIGSLFIAALALGGLCLYEAHKVHQARSNAEVSLQNASELQSSLAEQSSQTAHLREQLELARAQSAAQSDAARLKQRPNQSTDAPPQDAKPADPKPANALAEMFKNPEMKAMLRNQQKDVLGPMIDKNYARLYADLHLAPEQAAALKDLLLNKQLAAAEAGMSMFAGEADPAKRADLVQQIKTANDAADAQIKQFLGDDNFAQYQAYEKTMGERMAVNGLRDQLGAGSTPLTDDQEQQLIQVMAKARESFKFTTDFSDQSKFSGDFAAMFTEDKMNTYFQELGQLDQQYQAGAQAILSSDQLSAFGKYLNNQQGLQRAGMQMAMKMFAPTKPGGE